MPPKLAPNKPALIASKIHNSRPWLACCKGCIHCALAASATTATTVQAQATKAATPAMDTPCCTTLCSACWYTGSASADSFDTESAACGSFENSTVTMPTSMQAAMTK